jgi:G:T-mismatch repair DNA endonuclease (very short patch repair protein)
MKKEYKCPQCLNTKLVAESTFKEATRLNRVCKRCAMREWQSKKYGEKTNVEFTSSCCNCGKIKKHKRKNLSPTQIKSIKEIMSQKMCRSCSNSIHYTLSKNKKNTKPERELKIILKELNIKFKQSYKYKGHYYDFYLPEFNILVEVDGNYWHGKNLEWDKLNNTQKNSRINDEKKNKICLENQQPLIRLWEDEINKHSIQEKINRL